MGGKIARKASNKMVEYVKKSTGLNVNEEEEEEEEETLFDPKCSMHHIYYYQKQN